MEALFAVDTPRATLAGRRIGIDVTDIFAAIAPLEWDGVQSAAVLEQNHFGLRVLHDVIWLGRVARRQRTDAERKTKQYASRNAARS
jgi:hypothetical protein